MDDIGRSKYMLDTRYYEGYEGEGEEKATSEENGNEDGIVIWIGFFNTILEGCFSSEFQKNGIIECYFNNDGFYDEKWEMKYPHIVLEELLMQQYADEKTYSINDPKEERINILKSEDGQYSIFFLDKNGKKYILEQETENPFVFKRFYNEVTYYGETMRQIREYEKVFEDKLEDDAKIQLLGYQMKNGK